MRHVATFRVLTPAALAVLTALATLATPEATVAADNTHRIAVRPGERLQVDLETGADIRITGWSEDAVEVEAEFSGRDADIISFEVRRIDDGVAILSEFKERRRNSNSGGRVEIRVPDRFDLELTSMGGTIHIEGVEGEIKGETMGGELTLRRLGGTIDLTTMGGNIELSDSDVDGKVQTYGGNVHVRDVSGTVDGETMGGEVIYDNVRPPAGGRASEIKISTMGGDIRAPHAPYGADLETMGGNIEIESAGHHVRAETMGGNIDVGAIDGWVKATTMGGDVRVTMVGDPRTGRRDVRLISMGGDIRLTVPDGLSMAVDITLAYTKNSLQDYSIRSDFPLSINETPHWDYSGGSPRKSIFGTGTVKGGDHRIKIETINGDVELLRGE